MPPQPPIGLPSTFNMPPPTTSSRSRLPRSPEKQACFDAATAWFENDARTAQSCPVHDVTDLISTNISAEKSILSKYDPSKIAHLYSDMNERDSIDLVEKLRQEVSQRQERSLKWRQILTIAADKSTEDGENAQDWRILGMACQQALEVTRELKKKLDWCVAEFESERPKTDRFAAQNSLQLDEEDLEWDDLSEDLVHGTDTKADKEIWPLRSGIARFWKGSDRVAQGDDGHGL